VPIDAPSALVPPSSSRSAVSIQVSGGSVFSNDEKKPGMLIPLLDHSSEPRRR
jgi:hypothetical protein